MVAPHRIAVIADDLTGAADTGVQFCPVIGPVLLIDGASPVTGPSAAGLTISTESRHLGKVAAIAAIHQTATIIHHFEPSLVYKKIDSCLRGNPGSEIDATMSICRSTAAFIAPAYPQQGRTTLNGTHRINGVPVAESEVGRDPRCPVRTSRIASLLAGQSDLAAGHIGLPLLEGPYETLTDKIQNLIDRGSKLLIFDALHSSHLDRVAELVLRSFPDSLPVGSAGLADSLARQLVIDTPPHRQDSLPLRTWLFACGSASRILTAQTATLRTATSWPLLTVDPSDLTDAQLDQVLRDAQSRFLAGGSRGLILSISPLPDGGPQTAPERVAAGFADLAARLATILKPDGIFLSGGDIADSFRRRVQATGLLLQGQPVPGLVRSNLVGGPWTGQRIVTKAGGFGTSDTLVRLITVSDIKESLS